ncbi:RNA-directed DNA polymerase, eukaryota [Tanacetum coccineum]
MDDMIKVGQTMGYTMEGCMKDMVNIIGTQGVNDVILETMSKILIIAIYAPQSITEKPTLWQYITHLINLWNGECIVMGDFNEVRSEEERLGSSFNVSGANEFNAFIANSGLIDLHLEDRHLSDHRPILLREFFMDYGATPFRLFHSWFSWDGFDKLVSDSWNGMQLEDRNDMVRFKKKLQGLKKVIREWVTDRKKNHNLFIKDTKLKLGDIDKKLDCGEASDELLLLRMNLMQSLQEKNL